MLFFSKVIFDIYFLKVFFNCDKDTVFPKEAFKPPFHINWLSIKNFTTRPNNEKHNRNCK